MVDDLEVTRRRDGEVGYLLVGGEVRMEIASRLRCAGEDLLQEGARSLIIDLRRVVFMDSASLSALIRLDGLVSDAGGALVLCHVSKAVQLVLENSGLDARFTVADDQAAARDALR